MQFTRLNRKVHYWISAVLLLPIATISITGALLQLKKQLAWVQPTEQTATGEPAVAMAELLEIARRADPAVTDWQDITRVEVRPAKGLVKIVTASHLEIQVDAATGAVLQAAQRRSDWLESIHDGSYFGNWVKFGWFFPTAILLFTSTLTGAVLFVLPFILDARRKRIQQRLRV